MQRNPYFQSEEPEQPLTGIQKLLLQYTAPYGMTSETLKSWQSSYTGFCITHAEAVMYLIKQERMSAEAAMREIDNLTENEAALLTHFRRHGLTRNAIMQHRQNYHFDLGHFQETVTYLMTKQKLTFYHAMLQLKGLTAGQIYMLRDCYQYGLRHEHFAQANMSKIYLTYAQLKGNQDNIACRDALLYFQKIFMLSRKHNNPVAALHEAASELTKIYQNAVKISEDDKLRLPGERVTSRRIRFLLRSAYGGTRADHYPAVFTSDQSKTYYSLLIRHALHKSQALEEMKGLEADKLRFLRSYYGHGVNYKRLRQFPHAMNYVTSYMKRTGADAVDALDALAPLSASAIQYLHHLSDSGVTLQHVDSLPADAAYSEVRRNAAEYLIDTVGMNIALALRTAATEPEAELAQMIVTEPRTSMSRG